MAKTLCNTLATTSVTNTILLCLNASARSFGSCRNHHCLRSLWELLPATRSVPVQGVRSITVLQYVAHLPPSIPLAHRFSNASCHLSTWVFRVKLFPYTARITIVGVSICILEASIPPLPRKKPWSSSPPRHSSLQPNDRTTTLQRCFPTPRRWMLCSKAWPIV